jgi:high affinity Mn2+ porin
VERWSGAWILVLFSAAVLRAQEPASAASPDAATAGGGFHFGGHMGVLGGSAAWSGIPRGGTDSDSIGLFHAYDPVDGAGSHFGGIGAGYDHRWNSGVVLGGETDISFGAEPLRANGSFTEIAELFGTLRGRIGYGPRRWFAYGTGGLAWTRNQFAGTAGAGDGGPSDARPVFGQRVGWTLGAGIERSLDGRWRVNAEYLRSRFGDRDVALSPGTRITSALSASQVRIGLNYALGNADPSALASFAMAPLALDGWNVHAQTTYVSQYSAPFHAPYRGANSLDPNSGRETWDVTLYLGRRLWDGAALWINPEIDQGFGLSNTLGVAGFTSGEAYKVGHAHPYVRIPRAFVQQTIDLGGAGETVDAGLNQFGGAQTANRVVATIGKFSVSDLFDTIAYAHDPRSDFMNWSLVDAGTFDYAADAWGFTYGAALEWYQGVWAARAGFFDLSKVPNSVDLDTSFQQFQIVYELEHQHELRRQPGRLALVGFLSRGRMARYADALATADQRGTVPDVAEVRHQNSRPGLNLNVSQQVASDIGVFARVGWADGRLEPYEFTDIDRTASAGLSLQGRRWGRGSDTAGVAIVVNGISDLHRAYLAGGGLGILVGDGQLPHPGLESIVESYYRLPIGPWQLTGDYQLIVNPAFNRDRGPVSVVSARVRAQF